MEVSVMLARRAAEGAESTPDETDVGEVYVAVDHVSNHVAHAVAPHAVCRKDHRLHLPPARARQQQPSVEIKLDAAHRTVERARHTRINLRQDGIKPARFVPLNLIRRNHYT